MDFEKLSSIFDSVRVTTIKPGDAIVVRVNGRLTADIASMIRESVRDQLKMDVPVILLDRGADMMILRKE